MPSRLMSVYTSAITPVALEVLREVDHVVVRELGPAVDRQFAVAGVEPDDDAAREFQAQVVDEVRRADRLGADDHELDPGLEVGLYRVGVADAAADLDTQVRVGLGNGVDDLGVLRGTGEGAVEIDDVQALGAGIDPAPGHGHRVFPEHRGFLHAALAQAHALAFLEINRGYDQHHRLH
jgi:hypothetical protein